MAEYLNHFNIHSPHLESELDVAGLSLQQHLSLQVIERRFIYLSTILSRAEQDPSQVPVMTERILDCFYTCINLTPIADGEKMTRWVNINSLLSSGNHDMSAKTRFDQLDKQIIEITDIIKHSPESLRQSIDAYSKNLELLPTDDNPPIRQLFDSFMHAENLTREFGELFVFNISSDRIDELRIRATEIILKSGLTIEEKGSLIHEIRQPLTVMSGYLSLIADQRNPNPNFYQMICRSFNNILQSMEDALYLEESQFGPFKMVKKDSDIQGIEVNFSNPSTQTYTARLPRGRLKTRIAISEVLLNAQKYKEDNKKVIVTITEEVAVVDDQRVLKLMFTDNGPGIPKDELEAVRARMISGEGNITTKGTGRGLHAILATGIGIEIENRDSKETGLIVTLLIPIE